MHTVLVIDRDMLSMKLARLVLENDDWTVIEAESVANAHVVLAGMHVDLIVVDPTPSQLGEVSDLAHACRGTPVVAVTAPDGPGAETDALAAGCAAVVAKPIDVARFSLQLRSYLRRSR